MKSKKTNHGDEMPRYEWVNTPGLEYVRRELVPEAAETLKSKDNYEPVLLTGPTGTGKSYIKDFITEMAGFKHDDVLTVNCAAIPKSLIESELFGYKQGSFTGAKSDYEGLVGKKNKKLLVLDEIGTLPKYVQAKLLTFLDNLEYRPVGSNDTNTSEMRILGITNSEPKKSFREDFLYRFLRIEIPGLHARRQDIPHLLAFFAPNVKWTKCDLLRLMAYNWPGNVRELRRFARMASRHMPEIEGSLDLDKSVLSWFYHFRGTEYGDPIPTIGIPVLNTLSRVERQIREIDNSALKLLTKFAPMFALRNHHEDKRINFRSRPKKFHT